jgi:hypothetical protein
LEISDNEGEEQSVASLPVRRTSGRHTTAVKPKSQPPSSTPKEVKKAKTLKQQPNKQISTGRPRGHPRKVVDMSSSKAPDSAEDIEMENSVDRIEMGDIFGQTESEEDSDKDLEISM